MGHCIFSRRFCKYLQVKDFCQIYVAFETKSNKVRENEMRQRHDLHGDKRRLTINVLRNTEARWLTIVAVETRQRILCVLLSSVSLSSIYKYSVLYKNAFMAKFMSQVKKELT